MNLNIAICDDEKIFTDKLKKRLLDYNNDFQIDVFQLGRKLLENPVKYDLIFLDIEMPEMNGMDIAMELRKIKYEGHLVFLTSHMEFMPDAFKVKAFRFLGKPVNDLDFEETIKECEKEILNNKKLIVHSTDGIKFINLNDLICFETVKYYTYLYTKEGSIETRKSMREWMDILGTEHFIQVHKSYGVALRYIDTIESDFIVMKYTEIRVPISRRKAGNVKKAFFDYIKKYALFT